MLAVEKINNISLIQVLLVPADCHAANHQTKTVTKRGLR